MRTFGGLIFLHTLQSRNSYLYCETGKALEPMPGLDPDKIRRAYDADKDDLNNSEIDFRDSKIVALAKKSHKLQMLLNKERANGYLSDLFRFEAQK